MHVALHKLLIDPIVLINLLHDGLVLCEEYHFTAAFWIIQVPGCLLDLTSEDSCTI